MNNTTAQLLGYSIHGSAISASAQVVLDCLRVQGTDYLIVGGAAVKHYHPTSRDITADLDVWAPQWNATYSARVFNLDRPAAVADLGFFVKVQNFEVDILTRPVYLPWFYYCLANRQILNGLNVISLPDLLVMKFNAGQTKDLYDLSHLVKLPPLSN
jgi:hypothetical protein